MIGWISHVSTKSHPIGPDGKRVHTTNTTTAETRHETMRFAPPEASVYRLIPRDILCAYGGK